MDNQLISMLEKQEARFERSLDGIRAALRAFRNLADGRSSNGRHKQIDVPNNVAVHAKRIVSALTRRKIGRTQRRNWRTKRAEAKTQRRLWVKNHPNL